jgi:hypothetical protein
VDYGGSILCVIDIVVVLDPDAGAEPKMHWSNKEIIGNPINILTPGFARLFTGQRRPDRVLRPN